MYMCQTAGAFKSRKCFQNNKFYSNYAKHFLLSHNFNDHFEISHIQKKGLNLHNGKAI